MATFVNIEVASNANQTFLGAQAGSLLLYAQSNTQNIFLGSSNQLVPPITIVNSSKYIGIFNSNPQYPLDITGSMKIYGSSNAFRPTRQNSNVGVISQFTACNLLDGNSTGIFLGKNTNLYNGFELNYIQKGNTSSSNLLTITPSGQMNNLCLAITAAGYVGIGKSNPIYHLETSNNILVGSNVIATPNRLFIRGSFTEASLGLIPLNVIQSSGGLTITSTNRIVAPVAGVYKIGFSGIVNTSTGRYDIHIYVNGNYVASTLSEDNSSGFHYRCAAIAYYLNVNDYVQYYATQGRTYDGVNAPEWRQFYIYLVG